MKKIAVLTSGGDAPGMNACVRAVVRGGIYHGLEVMGITRGYDGLMKGDFYNLKSYSVSNILGRGGTILKSARSMEFKTEEGRKLAFENLKKNEIDGLIVIGGDGTFTGANLLYKEHNIPVIGCPGTIDNDLYGTDFTIGFDTAVNTALEAADKIRDTANSHERVFFVEVMGRDSGYIAMRTAIGCGAEFVMVPETKTTIDDVVHALKKGWDQKKSASIVITAEGDSEGSAEEIARKVIEKCPDKDIRVTTLGHIQRGGSPSAQDRILASRLGIAAVEGLLEGQEDVMAGIINNKIEYTPLDQAINEVKPLTEGLAQMVEMLSV